MVLSRLNITSCEICMSRRKCEMLTMAPAHCVLVWEPPAAERSVLPV